MVQGRNPKCVVALAAYNGAPWVKEQIDSILSQKGVNVVVFVSVDPSSDGTGELIEELGKNDSRVVLLPGAGRFGSAGKNFFRLVRDIDLSGYDYLAFADQDDVWCEDKLLCAHKKITELGCDAYSSNVTAVWPDGRERLVNKAQPQRKWDFLFEAAGPGCTYVFTIRLAKAVQRLVEERWDEVNEIWLHDWLFYAFARVNGYAWYIDSRPGLRYRQHERNQVGVNSGWTSMKTRLNKIRSGWARDQCRFVADVAGVDRNIAIRRALEDGWKGNLVLASKAWQARRKPSARFGFFLLCVFNQF